MNAPSDAVLLWAGGYSPGMEGSAEGIGLVRWDGAELSFLRTVAAMPSPSFLALDDGVLAAVDEGAGSVHTFAVGDDGELASRGDSVATSGGNPCHVATARIDGERMLLTTSYAAGSVDAFAWGADGVASLVASFTGSGSGPRAEQQGPHAHSTLVVPGADGPVVLSADLGADTVHVLALSAGSLERRSSLALPPGTGPRDLVSVDGRLLLLGEFGGEVFELDLAPRGANGVVSIVSSGALVGDPVVGDQAAGLVAGPGARFLYVGLRGSNRVAVMDASSLAPIASVSCGGDWPRHLAVVGQTLFVSNQRSGSVAAFSLDPDSGVPTFLASTAVPTPTFLMPVPNSAE